MPHIIMLHSLGPSLDSPPLLQQMHNALSAHETVDPATVKTYEIPVSNQITGDHTRPDHMVHVQVRMKPGRSIDIRRSLSETLHNTIFNYVKLNKIETNISVEIHELDEPTYISSHT